ncbi:MAG TPA: DUF839 domain-containing protein [Brevundimonas sp.]|uniref:alkaline phosphatase PhoX n=1 Tax=Brevundimonas sp. TaxID=1871086 RepID=UPI00260646B9|nr:alkaline phosphatase PhoX [Brevundimonas sp.]HRO34410.1 DUF839 domain-containing protein [Brevundimonas sp.]
MRLDRRGLISGGAAVMAFSGLSRSAVAQTAPSVEQGPLNQVPGYGALKPDANRILDLPEGFSYRIIAQGGETMDDGLFLPGQFDGMACFPAGGTRVALVRNHELRHGSRSHRNWGPGGLNQERLDLIPRERAYGTYKNGKVLPGGTSTQIYDLATGRTVSQRLSLAGTSTNCAGGLTPWGSWLTCEETEATPDTADVAQTHGWVFEVPALDRGLADPVPLKAMGRFDHEAVAVDPRTGVVYLTEDKIDGLFYRFIPEVRGEMARGGRLQAMVIRDKRGADTSNKTDRLWNTGDGLAVDWIDLAEVESPNGDLRQRGHADGAALVSRGEGIHWGDGELYLTATSGGPIGRGQVLRYVPSPDEGRAGESRRPGRLQLFVESTDARVLNMGDNLTVAPWGHLFVCEDNYSEQNPNFLRGVTPDGRTYAVAKSAYITNSEFAGVCFSPDGSVLFVNVQTPGITFAITGPWATVQM